MPPQIVCSMHLCSYHTKLGGKLSFHAFREVMHLEEMQIERFDCTPKAGGVTSVVLVF